MIQMEINFMHHTPLCGLTEHTFVFINTHKLTYRCYLAHVDGEGLCPAIKQLEEKEALMCWNFISVIDDEDIV